MVLRLYKIERKNIKQISGKESNNEEFRSYITNGICDIFFARPLVIDGLRAEVEKEMTKISDRELGKLNLWQYVNAKRRAKLDEVKEYEKKYLTRVSKSKKPSPKKLLAEIKRIEYDVDLISGRINLSKQVAKKRKALSKKRGKKR